MSRKPQVVVKSGNSFAALASDSEDEGNVPGLEGDSLDAVEEPKQSSPPFRVWSLDDSEKRFKNDTNIFSSPFSRKKGWSKPRFKEDGEGWVSIEVGKPESEGCQPEGEGEAEPEAEAEAEANFSLVQEFPSMLTRGDQEAATIWAEKVKKSLDRAEKIRVEFKRGKDNSSDIGTRLSFFRGGNTGSEKQ